MVAGVRQQAGGLVRLELFRPQQYAFGVDDAYAVAAVTGRGAGKTYAGAVKLLKYVVDYPGAAVMVTAPTYPMLHDAPMTTVWETWPKALLGDWKQGMPAAKGPVELLLPNGSVVMFRSTDEPDRLRGPNLSAAWMDEAAYSTFDAFDAIRGGIRDPKRPNQIWMTTTPKGFNWLYDFFVGEKRKENYHLHHWTSMENPFVRPEFVERIAEGKTREAVLQEINGEFVNISGNIQFDQEWITSQMRQVREVRPEYNEDHISLTLYAPYDPTHEYALGVDPKGQGSDLGFGAVLDFTFGAVIGKLRSTNKDSTVLLDHSIALAKRYGPRGVPEQGCLCIPENNGVGAAYAPQMLKAGCRVFKKKRLPDETPEHYRTVNHGWHAGESQEVLTTLQRVIRQHRLSSPDREFWHTAGAWDPVADRHLPDYLSATGLAVAGAAALWGEMGSTVAQAERHQAASGPMWRAGGRTPLPFRAA